MLSKLYWQAYFRARNFSAHWAELDQFQVASPLEQKRIISARLLSQIHYFGNRSDALPEWRDAATAKTPEEAWTLWPSLPILTKEDIQSKFSPERIRDAYGVDGKINKTGGSTGKPTRFIWDKESLNLRYASQYYCWTRFGWEAGTSVISIWGSPRDLGLAEKPRTKALRRLQNVHIIDGYRFGQSTVDRVRTILERSKRVCIYGYTSLLEQLAQAFQSIKTEVPENKVTAAWNGGEAVSPEQSEYFKSVFGVPIQDLYGGREFGALAFAPEGFQALRILRPNTLVELVDESGNPCRDGEVGRIVVTSLGGKGTPFLRYENGDLATAHSMHKDESGIHHLSSLEGRKSGLIKLQSGGVLHNIFWGMLFKEFPAIKQYQVRQRKDRSIFILLEGNEASLDKHRIIFLLQSALEGTPFELRWVDHIPLSEQGKLVQVHSDVE